MTTEEKPSEKSPEAPTPVLVVEDSSVNLQLALTQLQNLGYAARSATNGREALDALEQHPTQIILMDCQMPEMDGFEATWQIRNRESEKAKQGESVNPAYIIAMTADSADDSREKCLTAGMNDYIRKPVQLATLEAALDRAKRGAPPGDTEEVLDPLILAGLRLLRQPGKPDPVAELIRLFLQEAPAHLQEIGQAIAANDMWSMSKVVAATTSLKGCAGNLGARKLAGLSGEMEEAARAGTLDEVESLLPQAREELDRVQKALEQLA